MKVTKITMKNLLGLEEFDLDPGAINIIEGGNERGKSSILQGLQCSIEGGSLAELHRVGSDEPAEVCLVFDGDDGQVILEKDEKGLKIRRQVDSSKALKKESAPQRWIEGCFHKKLLNPVAFLNATDKERVQMLLESVDLDYNPMHLWAAMRLNPEDFEAVPSNLSPLEQISLHRDHIFKKRTGLNTSADGARKASDQILQQIPSEVPTIEDVTELVSRKEALANELKAGRDEINRRMDTIYDDHSKHVEDLKKQLNIEYLEYQKQLKEEMDAKLAAKRAEFKDKTETFRLQGEEKTREAIRAANDELATIDERQVEVDAMTAEISTAKERSKRATEIAALRRQADEFADQYEEFSAKADKLTEALKALDAYKATMCSHLPIPGLDISGNKITLDGVPWATVNTAKKHEIAAKIATMHFADSPWKPVIFDGAEALDPENFESLCQHLEAAGAQAFIGRVTSGPMKIEKRETHDGSEGW